jgi:hypothetical protein
MRKQSLPLFFSLCGILLAAYQLSAQSAQPLDSTGRPGDDFSLEGALELFKKAESPADFEKLLNTEGSAVNNLDLNEDGEIDYIRVIDRMENDVHAFVLQAPVSESESQDVAVIEIEKTGAETAILQIVGDEELYGKDFIVEPFEEEKAGSGRNGPAPYLGPVRVVVNVWLWPSVRYVYRPGYVAYVSPWRWRAYPGWWRPWRPLARPVFFTRVHPFRAHYHVATVHRVPRAHRVYVPHRTHSTVVHTKTVSHHGRHGQVEKTTKTTKVHGPRGTKTTKTTKVEGPRGNTKTKKTTTRRGRRG